MRSSELLISALNKLPSLDPIRNKIRLTTLKNKPFAVPKLSRVSENFSKNRFRKEANPALYKINIVTTNQINPPISVLVADV